MKLIAYMVPHETTAGFSLIVSVVDDEGSPRATIAHIDGESHDMQQRLADIHQAYRMGARFGSAD
jgi:hypothetical protein